MYIKIKYVGTAFCCSSTDLQTDSTDSTDTEVRRLCRIHTNSFAMLHNTAE
jgi:hypothetical protein